MLVGVWAVARLYVTLFSVPRDFYQLAHPLHRVHRHASPWSRLPFDIGKVALRSTQVSALRRLLRFAIDACALAGAQCFLDSGTLLGQYRHAGDVMPHDEDADLIVLFDDLARLRAVWREDEDGDDGGGGGGGNYNVLAQLRAEQPDISFVFSRHSPKPMPFPLDIVAHVVDSSSVLYVDIVLFFETKMGIPGGRCGFTAPAPRPDRATYSAWPSDLSGAELFARTRSGTPAPRHAAWNSPGCEYVHGLFSSAWSGCHGCEHRASDSRRCVHMPSRVVFPLRACTMVGRDNAWCPNDVPAYLAYEFGADFAHSPFHFSRHAQMLYAVVCAGALAAGCAMMRSSMR
jgi:hypothetical protein